MLAILEACPIHANGLVLYFDKSPNIFDIPRMKYVASEHLGFFEEDSLKGFGSLGFYDALIKGQKENVFTFYNFYLLPEARGKKITHTCAKEFFSMAREKANYGISITLKGNRATESYIGSRMYDWAPASRIIDELVVKSILFAFPKKNKTSYKVRNASVKDIPELVKLLQKEHTQRDFGLPFSEESFQANLTIRGLAIENYYVAMGPGDAIKGVCLAWDCTSFRRTRIEQFSLKFYPSLLAYKTLERLFPLAAFPNKGENFNELTITDYAITDRDPAIMHALLSEIYDRHYNRNYHFMNWASCASDPLLIAAKNFWYKNITSHIIMTSMDEKRFNIKTHLPYIDIAFI